MTIGAITYENDPDINAHNSHLWQRNVKATYEQLISLFGEPITIKKPDHSRVEWRIMFSDGEVMFVYDWNDDRRIYDVDQWNVGGFNFNATSRIYDILAGRPIFA